MMYQMRPPAPAEGDPAPNGGGAPAPASGGAGEVMIPSIRFREETAAKREALDRVQSLERELAAERAKARTADTLATQLEAVKGEKLALQASHEKAAAAWAEDREIFGLGVADLDAIDVLRHLHSRLPADARPPLVDWVRPMRDDPTKAPLPVRYAFHPAAPASTPAPGASPAPAPVQGTPPRPGPVPPASGGTRYTADQIAALVGECQRTGDWKPWEAAQAAINGSLGRE